MAEEVEWFVGIDWASQSHQVCLIDARESAWASVRVPVERDHGFQRKMITQSGGT